MWVKTITFLFSVSGKKLQICLNLSEQIKAVCSSGLQLLQLSLDVEQAQLCKLSKSGSSYVYGALGGPKSLCQMLLRTAG